MRTAKSLLWIDCSGGLTVGALVLAFSPWLSTLYGLPIGFICMMGAANLIYGGYSLFLARRTVRPLVLLRFLVAANLGWTGFCAGAAAYFAAQASTLGLTQMVLEGIYVGGLGLLEWKYLDTLRSAAWPQ